MTRTAAETYVLRLQVGRVLPRPLLAVAVALRELALSTALQGGLTGLAAPAWVVVTEGTVVVLRVPAGREPEAGPELLAEMRTAAGLLGPEQFLRRFGPGPSA